MLRAAQPRPPDTTIDASVSSGRPDDARTSRPVTVAASAAADSSSDTSCTSGATSSGTGLVAFGFTAITGTPTSPPTAP